MGATDSQAHLYEELDKYIDSFPNKRGILIAVLHKAQEIFGYLPQELQQHVARKLEIAASRVFGVVTFYSFLKTEPRGQFCVNVCLGTACFVRGSENILHEFEKDLGIKSGQTTEDGQFSLDAIRCVGACGLAPVVMVNDQVYGRVQVEDVKNIVEEQMAKVR